MAYKTIKATQCRYYLPWPACAVIDKFIIPRLTEMTSRRIKVLGLDLSGRLFGCFLVEPVPEELIRRSYIFFKGDERLIKIIYCLLG
jgi:hypothetical protein